MKGVYGKKFTPAEKRSVTPALLAFRSLAVSLKYEKSGLFAVFERGVGFVARPVQQGAFFLP